MKIYINGILANGEDLEKLWQDIKSGKFIIKANFYNNAFCYETNN